MPRNPRYDLLFEPVKIGPVTARNRFYQEDYTLLSAERHDRVRRKGETFELVRREVRMDQSVLGMPNLAIFL